MIGESNPFHDMNFHDLDTVLIKINYVFFPDSTLNFKLFRFRDCGDPIKDIALASEKFYPLLLIAGCVI